jgi:signal transduction histidine kinase
MSSGGSNDKAGRHAFENPASHCACGVLVIGARERIAVATPEAAALLQLSAAGLLDAPLHSLPAPLVKIIRNVIADGKPETNREFAANDTTVLRANILPVKSEIIVVLDPLPAAPDFEPNMRRLDRLASLGTLAAGMAHEIKNGMVAVKTFVELLLEKGQDAELNEVVGRELKRIDRIVSQMLRFASPKHSALTTVRVHDTLDYSLRLLEHQINGKMISLKRHYQAAPDTIRGDDAQLQQAFMNLFFNAIEAMGANGVLTVSTEIMSNNKSTQLLKIQIQDTGVGIASENLGRLFEPFFTTKKNGTGLGLAICQRIAREHQGMIEVESEANRGSKFSVLLPVAA